MLRAPLGAGATHIVLFGVVGTEQFGTHAAPQVSDGLADAWCFELAGHDTFPLSRRVPTAGSAFLSRSMSAWFRGHDATELVKIRYNFASVVFLISNQSFRSFTDAADTCALARSYALVAVRFRLRVRLALT